MSLAPSHLSPSDAPSPEVLLAAYKAEVKQLRDALHEVALRDTGGGAGSSTKGTFGEVLEGKYLATIKKNKDLTVQLGTTQRQLTAVQTALQAEQEKAKRLVSAVTASSLGERAGKDNAKSWAAAAAVKDNDEKDAGNNHSNNGGNGVSVTSSVAVARVYDQLHHKEIAMAEVLRENAALRSLIQREVGLRDDTKEVDGLLRRVTPTLNGGGDGGPAAAPGTNGVGWGWRGRAEEIILLKSKLKDLQRELSMAVAQSSRSDDGADVRTDTPALPAPVRAFLGADTESTAEARSVAATTATAQGRRARRDVDNEARDRLNVMQQQRAAQLRQLTDDLVHHQHLLSEERMKSSALQARVKTMKSELDTMRAYVDTILEKSNTDDELVAAYKIELQHAHEDTRHWQRVIAEVANGASGASSCGSETVNVYTVSGMHNGLNHAAAAATRIAPYQKAVGGTASAAPAPGGGGNGRSMSEPLSPSQLPRSFSRSLYEWVCQACEEEPHNVERNSTSPAVAASARQLAAVLRQAFQYVLTVEKKAAAERATHGHKADNTDDILLKENTMLRNRIRALSDMLEKELQMQSVLWATTDSDVAQEGRKTLQ